VQNIFKAINSNNFVNKFDNMTGPRKKSTATHTFIPLRQGHNDVTADTIDNVLIQDDSTHPNNEHPSVVPSEEERIIPDLQQTIAASTNAAIDNLDKQKNNTIAFELHTDTAIDLTLAEKNDSLRDSVGPILGEDPLHVNNYYLSS
jgi:hypothetical protein